MTLKINIAFLACVVALSSAAVGSEGGNVNQPKRSQTTEALRRLKNAVVENTTAKDNKGNVIESIKCLPEDLKADLGISQHCPVRFKPGTPDDQGKPRPNTMMNEFEWNGQTYAATPQKLSDLGNWIYSSKSKIVAEVTIELLKQSKDIILITTNTQHLDPTRITSLNKGPTDLTPTYQLVNDSEGKCRYRIAKSKLAIKERGCISFEKK